MYVTYLADNIGACDRSSLETQTEGITIDPGSINVGAEGTSSKASEVGEVVCKAEDVVVGRKDPNSEPLGVSLLCRCGLSNLNQGSVDLHVRILVGLDIV